MAVCPSGACGFDVLAAKFCFIFGEDSASLETENMADVDRLRDIIMSPGCSVAPGAYDAWSARLIEQAGFPLCYLTGFGASASHLGAPDIGLITGTEMADLAARVAEAVSIPVIADADTGYGNALNVRHIVRAYRRAGVAAMQLEDQEFPKRCGHLDGKHLVAADEMVSKIEAAKDEAEDSLLIIARTDARAVLGFEEALERGHAYEEAGADILLIEAPRNLDELERVGQEFPKTPLLANIVEGGKTPYLSADVLGKIGFAVAIYPITTLLAATGSIKKALSQMRDDGGVALEQLPSFSDLHDVSGLDGYLDDARGTSAKGKP